MNRCLIRQCLSVACGGACVFQKSAKLMDIGCLYRQSCSAGKAFLAMHRYTIQARWSSVLTADPTSEC